MNILRTIGKFIIDLITPKSGISSNRFLGVFLLTPTLIIAIFLQLDISYIYVLSGLISAFMIGNAVGKHKNFKENNGETQQQ